MTELEDAPWVTEGASDLPDAPWAAPAKHESSAPQWMKSVGAGADKLARAFPLSAPFTAPIAALPETYDIAAEGIKSLGDPANPFTEEREAIKREAMKSGPLLSGASEEGAERIADRQISNRRRQEALGTPLKALSILASPLQGMLRHYGSQPLEDVGGPPKEVTEGFAGIGAAAAGLRPGMNTIRKSFGLPLEGEVLPPQGGPRGGGPGIAPGGEGPSAALRDWLDQPLQSPMTPREGTNARLLPHDYQGTGIAGDPHFDAAWESLGSRGSMGAAGRPGGPLADIHPEAIQTMRDIIREEGLSPWELERRQEEERSPHHFGGEWSDAMRNELRGLNSLGGEGANIIGQSVRARRRDAPERMREKLREFFGERLDPREEAASRKKADAEAAPFWREFDATPIPPTAELAALDDALKVTGAWRGAEKALRTERVPRENYFVELPDTGEYVLANPALPSETISVPTAKFYQSAKVYIDGLIDDAVDRRKTNDVRILTGLKNALTEAIDNHPDPTVAGLWKRSREVSAGPRQWDSAIALGKRAMSEHVDPGDFSMLWDTLSDQQKIGVRKGAHELLGSMLGRKGSADINTMKHVLGDNNQQKLRTMQESEGAADRLISNVEHEHGMAQGPLTGPNTADKLAAQQRYKPKETWSQTVKMEDLPKGVTHGLLMGGKKAWEAKQAKMVAEAQKKQNLINADIARLMTLQGPEWNAVVRYLHGVEPTEPSPGAGPRPSPRPAPARPAGDVEPPPPSQVPEGPPGYPQPEMTVMEATRILREEFGYPQEAINRIPPPTRMQTAQNLLDERREAARNAFPGDAAPAASPAQPRPAAAQSPPKGDNPLSLVEWIRKQGGISPSDKFAPEIKGIFGGNPGAIVRTGGKSLENLLKAAKADKYLFDPSDVTGAESTVGLPEFLDLIQRDHQTEDKVYPTGSEVKQARNKDLEAHDQEQKRDLEFSPEARRLDRELAQYGVTRDMMPTDVRQRAVDMLRSGIERDPVEAFEKAMNEKLQGDLEGEHAAEIGEGLEPSPQSHGMAARGNRAAPQGQSGTGQDVRGAGERDRAEKEPLRLKVLERGRSGRPIKTERMRMGDDVNQAILEAGRKKVGDAAEAKKSAAELVTLYHGTNDEGHAGISHDKLISGQVSMTPRKEIARQFGEHIITARVPKGDLLIDLDLPRARLLTVEEANGYGKATGLDTDGWTIDDWLRKGYSVGVKRDVPLNRATGGRVDASAINSDPSEAQKEAGNYAKDHVRVHGLDLTIENAKGSARSGIDKGGKPWSVSMPAAYGYIKKTEGADGDHVDCYLGPHLKSSRVFVVDQLNAETGKFDEHKCFIGFSSASQARNCYLRAFSDARGKKRLGAIHEMSIDAFKKWLAKGGTTRAMAA